MNTGSVGWSPDFKTGHPCPICHQVHDTTACPSMVRVVEVDKCAAPQQAQERIRELEGTLKEAHTVISQARHYVSHRDYHVAIWVLDKGEDALIAALRPGGAAGGNMSDNMGSWPEQDAVEKWWEAHSFELKETVTKARLAQQRRADEAEALAAPDAKHLRALLRELLAQWRKEITGASRNTDYLRGYWEGRATAHNDLHGSFIRAEAEFQPVKPPPLGDVVGALSEMNDLIQKGGKP